MPATKIKNPQRKRNAPPRRRGGVTLDRYLTEAREIAAARQAMEQTRKGVIEFEPERLQYVTDLHML